MKESYREGVANHPGPQPCEGGREAALEAWERGIRRQDIQLRNPLISGADGVRAAGRQHEGGRQRETALDPAESKTPGGMVSGTIFRGEEWCQEPFLCRF